MPNERDHSEGAASAYRAYLIGDAGRVETATPIDATTDQDAIEQAKQLVDGHLVELWDRTRVVVRLEPARD